MLSTFTKLPCYTLELIQHPSFLGNLPPLSILITCLLNNVWILLGEVKC